MAQLFALWRICILTGSMPVNLPQGVCVKYFSHRAPFYITAIKNRHRQIIFL